MIGLSLSLGLSSSQGGGGGGEPAPDYGTDGRYKILVTADKDYANERDDEAANAIWFANQDKVNILGLVYDAADGILPPNTGSNDDLMLDAYGTDYATVSTYGTAGQFKTEAALRALAVQGPQSDALSKGYWESGDTEFAEAEAAADLILQQAAAFGDPTGTFQTNPKGKLLIIGQGGCASMAQALYRAVVLGELPDFCERVVWLYQSKHNSLQTDNCWKFIMARHWQASGVPGVFGDLQIINPCWLAHACNNEGTIATENWRYVVDMGATGAALETERAAGNYPNTYFRAGDAWFCWFLWECDRLGVYDPTNVNMDCGYLRTIEDGTRYPWQTGAWGPSNAAGGWSTSGTTDSPWSPNHYIPLDAIDSLADAVAAVDLTSWYGTVVQAAMARYQVPASAAGSDVRIAAAMTNGWGMTEGSGQTVANKVSGKTALQLGSTSGSDAADPSWVTGGIDCAGGDYLHHPGDDGDMDGTKGHTWVFMSKLNAVATGSNTCLFGRDHDATGNTTRQRQIRYANGNLNDLYRYGASTTNTQTTDPIDVDTNWSLSVAYHNRNANMRLRVDGVQVHTATLGGTPNSGVGSDIYFGARNGGSDPLNGILGFVGHFKNLPESLLPDLEAFVLDQFETDHSGVTHGITLP